MVKHLFIPDTQVKAGVNTDHIEALGNYICEKKPDRIILAGDWWDMEATSRWNSAKEQEGLRIVDDIKAGNDAMARLWHPMMRMNNTYARWKKRKYAPDIHMTMGNHEYHIERFAEANPVLEGMLGYHLLDIGKYGIQQHEFKKPVCLDGVWYCHYFYQPNSGRPYSGMMETRLKNIGHTFTQGHAQGFLYGNRILPNGDMHIGLVAGSFYSHFEGYRGHQANHEWRGVIMKHRVQNGRYSIMQVDLDYLVEEYF